jgi:hypothetical protein
VVAGRPQQGDLAARAAVVGCQVQPHLQGRVGGFVDSNTVMLDCDVMTTNDYACCAEDSKLVPCGLLCEFPHDQHAPACTATLNCQRLFGSTC